jgi:hypothetical protein
LNGGVESAAAMELMTLGVLKLADYSCCKAVQGHRLAAIRFSILNASVTNERKDQYHDSNHDGT